MTDLSREYGDGLYALCAEEGIAKEILEQLQALKACFDEQPDFCRLLSNMSLSKQERVGIVDRTLRGQVHPYVLNFLKILCERGALHALKDFSLPISMSFRLFGALLSGLLVTELVYYYVNLSFVLPVIVGVMFTLLHALIQAYVLTMLVALYFGEVSEKQEPKKKKVKAEAEN